MPRFLVPIDFSAVSVNAALYAVQMAEQMPRKEVILFNTIEEINAGVDGTPIDFNSEALVASNLAALENLQVNLFEMGMSPMEVVAEIGELPERLKPAIKKYNVDMVVMGITGTSSYDDNFLGKNALDISRENTCPVMIVPPNAMFKGSGKIAIAVEYKDVDTTVTLTPIKKWLDVLQPEIHFIYVAPSANYNLTDQQLAEQTKLKAIFHEYNTTFSLVSDGKFSDAVNSYIDENEIDQIIVFPKKHSMLENLFSSDHTKKLAYFSHVPVISVHN
jgi:nucleotide-binding universal stress UspA family protein